MISESQERMVAVVEPERFDEVAQRCERWELPCTVIGEVTDHGELRAFFDDEVVGSIPARAPHRRVPALRGRAARASASRARRSRPSTTSRRTGCSSSTTSSSARAPCAGPGLDAAVLRVDGTRGLAVSLDGPPLGCRDPREAGLQRGARRGAERRLRRRRAARAHRLPQLRQPREAGDRLGARAGDRGHRAGGRVARHPRRLGQRLALQRDRRRADPADAGRRLRRPRPRRDADPRPLAERRRRAAPARVRSRSRRASSGDMRTCSRSRTTCRTAAWRSRSRGGSVVGPRRRRRRRRSAGRDRRRDRARTCPWDDVVELGSGGADVRRLRRPRARTATSRASPTSGSTRCSTAGRSRPGSPSARTAG